MSDTRNEWTVLSMLKWATTFFESKGVKSPRFSIEWLLADVLEIKRLDLYLKYDRPLSQIELENLRPLVKRRAQHEPLQYITGETTFYNSVIKVNPSVLIPRQETEQLVQLILDRHSEHDSLNVLDIGTGSGCIPIALKKERPNWNMSAIDISEDALITARENAELNETKINFTLHDLFDSNFSESELLFDVIISNPPYILQNELPSLDLEVKNFEPHLALFCDSTESMFQSIENFCSQNLTLTGKIYLEIHENHATQIVDIFTAKGWKAEAIQDLNEKPRFIFISK